MRKIILFLTITLALASCNATKITQSWVKENCTEEHTLDANGESHLYVRCANLYPTEKVKKICAKSNICYDASNAVIEVQASCGDSTTNIATIIKAVLKR